MPVPHTLYFIRHGETDWNRAGRLQGQREIDLNATGHAQAARNGQVLGEYLREHDLVDLPIVASPMRRVQQTLTHILDGLGRAGETVPSDDRLKEIAFGEHEGFTPAEMKAQFPEIHRARKADKWGYAPPGGESYAQFSERVGGWLRTVERDMVVVAHGGVSRVIRGHLHGMTGSQVVELPTPQDVIMIMARDRMDLL